MHSFFFFSYIPKGDISEWQARYTFNVSCCCWWALQHGPQILLQDIPPSCRTAASSQPSLGIAAAEELASQSAHFYSHMGSLMTRDKRRKKSKFSFHRWVDLDLSISQKWLMVHTYRWTWRHWVRGNPLNEQIFGQWIWSSTLCDKRSGQRFKHTKMSRAVTNGLVSWSKV